MTLISAFASPSVGFVGVTDTLISREQDEQAPKIFLPVRSSQESYHFGHVAIPGLCQKTIILLKTLIMWSGSMYACRLLIERLIDASQGGNRFVQREEFVETCVPYVAGASHQKIIYWFDNEGDYVSYWEWNCLTEKHGDARLIYEGSGARSYIWETNVDAASGCEPRTALLGGAFARAISHLHIESLNADTLRSFYGGWFEFTNRGLSGFEKVPYAVFRWSHSGSLDSLKLHVLLFSGYIGDKLLVCRIHRHSDKRSNVVTRHGFFVKTLLDSEPIYSGTVDIPTYDPYLIVYSVLDERKDAMNDMITFRYEKAGFEAFVHQVNGFHIKANDSFLEKLLWLSETPTDLEISL